MNINQNYYEVFLIIGFTNAGKCDIMKIPNKLNIIIRGFSVYRGTIPFLAFIFEFR